MLFSPQIFACLPDVKKSLDIAMAYAKTTELKGNSFDESWYHSINQHEDLIPDLIIAYGQAGCWEEAIDLAKLIQDTKSEQQNRKYAYAISNLAILKAFNRDYNSAKSMLSELKYKSQVTSNIYGTLIIAEIMTKNKKLDEALELIKSNRHIEKSSYTGIINNLLSTEQFELAALESKKTSNTEILFPYLKYLSEKNAKDEAYSILTKSYNELPDKGLYFWGTRDIAMSYARFDDIERIQEISNKIVTPDKILLLSYSIPLIKSEKSRTQLKDLIFKYYNNLNQEKKLLYINEISENYALAGELNEFYKLIGHTTKNISDEYSIQLAAISFIKVLLYKKDLSLAKKSLSILDQYIKPDNDYYFIQALISIEDGDFEKAYSIAQKSTFISSDLVFYVSSKNIGIKSLSSWYTASTNNKICATAECIQAASARIASLGLKLDPEEIFKTENSYIIARSWFGYAQGKMQINPGIENVLHVLLPSEHNNSDSLLYQLYKSN